MAVAEGLMNQLTAPPPTPEMIAALLGIPLFHTDLYIPEYPVAEIGPWRITHCPLHTSRGYWGASSLVAGMPVLLRQGNSGWETWMSMSPYELESQELGCRYAHGHTVVMGLGMAWIAINAALNSKVGTVTVVERDGDVINLVKQSGILERAPSQVAEKITIVQADALTWSSDTPVDFLYADIWLQLCEPQTLEQVRQMQRNVSAKSIYFWGQELVIRKQAATLEPDVELDHALLTRVVNDQLALPLLIPPDLDYSALIRKAYSMRPL